MKSKAKKQITIFISFCILLGALPILDIQPKSQIACFDVPLDKENLKSSKISGKIHIINNSGWVDFRNAGNCSGSGTYSDPYVIEDLIIDGGGLGSCIRIENTDIYFRIENCTVYNSRDFYNAGIQLSNVNNSHLLNNNCSSNDAGIGLVSSFNNNITGNSIFNNNKIGIHLGDSNYNTILGNSVSNTSEGGGIGMSVSENNTIKRNFVNNNNYTGIVLYVSNYNIITGNSVNNNTMDGILTVLCHNNNIDENIVIDNEINGIRLDGGCYNKILRNNASFNGWNGIRIDYAEVYPLKSSYCNIISGNSLINNSLSGIFLFQCLPTLIEENIINYNYNGISLWSCRSTIISKNIVNNNTCLGIYLYSSDLNSISKNTLQGNNQCIIEEYCEENTFKDNEFCDYGEVSPIIPGYPIFFLIGIIASISIIFIIQLVSRHRKRKMEFPS